MCCVTVEGSWFPWRKGCQWRPAIAKPHNTMSWNTDFWMIPRPNAGVFPLISTYLDRNLLGKILFVLGIFCPRGQQPSFLNCDLFSDYGYYVDTYFETVNESAAGILWAATERSFSFLCEKILSPLAVFRGSSVRSRSIIPTNVWKVQQNAFHF